MSEPCTDCGSECVYSCGCCPDCGVPCDKSEQHCECAPWLPGPIDFDDDSDDVSAKEEPDWWFN